jgi:hypothetical protein
MSEKVRISIDVDKALKKELSKILPWGTQNRVYRALFLSLIRMCKEHGNERVIGALIAGKFDLFEGGENGRSSQPEEKHNRDDEGRA